MCESSQISSNPTPISPPLPATITLLDPPQLSSAETIQGPCLTLKPIKSIMDHLGSLNVWLTFFSIHRIIVVLQSRSFFQIYSVSNPPLPSPGLSLSHSPPPSDPAHPSPLLSPPCNNRKYSSSPRRERMSEHVCFVLLAISTRRARCSLQDCARL